VDAHAIRDLPTFDEVSEAAIAAALPGLRSSVARITLGRATTIIEPLLAYLRAHPDVRWALPAGSLRRGQETVGDVEIVVSAGSPGEVVDELCKLPDVLRCLHRSERRVYFLFERVQVGIRFPEEDRAGVVLLQLTGSSNHLAVLRMHAIESGW